MEKKRVLIVGASGRDMHNFLMYFKDNPYYEVVAFTQTQIPGIEKRSFPKELAGRLYKKNIPFFIEEKLSKLIIRLKVDKVVFAYSDVNDRHLMNIASIVLSAGADFYLLGPKSTMVENNKPIISVCATRTGAGKGSVTRKILDILKERYSDKRIVCIRHPMPYNKDLKSQVVQKFSSIKDFEKYKTTYEEEEEYNPYIEKGFTIFSGIDYKKILKEAEKEGDIIVFESGNNDLSFFNPHLYITVADPTRPDGIYSYPGETNVRLAQLIIINKVNLVTKNVLGQFEKGIKEINKKAKIIKTKSILKADNPHLIRNRNVVLVDDAPSITHGGLKDSVAHFAAKKYKAKRIIDPKEYAVGFLKKTFREYNYLKSIPTVGYSKKQKKDFIKTVNNIEADSIVFGSYAYLGEMKFNKPIARITYELEEIGKPQLEKVLIKSLKKRKRLFD